MAVVYTKYAHTNKLYKIGTLNWATDTYKLALFTSGYTFSSAHTQLADLVPASNELSGTNYTAGGKALTTLTYDNTKLTADDVVWTELTGVFRCGVLYRPGTVGGLTDPVMLHILYDDTGGGVDITVTAADFYNLWDSAGIFIL
jgi:hypothetical protein